VTVYSPAYRLAIMSPRSVDLSESTALTPRAGALHTDPFKVTTLGAGIAAPAKITSGTLSHSGMTVFTAAACVDDVLNVAAWGTDSAVTGAWLQIDLGAGVARGFRTCRIRVQDGAGGTYAGIYDVEYSDNGSVWTKAALSLKPVTPGTWTAIGWADVSTHRYWRILLTNTPGAGPELSELEFWELGGPGAWKPYLRPPEGRRGIFDPLTRKLDTGVMVAGLIDRQLTPGNNLQRWVTQFLGDTKNRNQLLGLLAKWDESLDGGATWSAFFTGRIDVTRLEEKNAYSVPCRDGADEMNVDVFIGRPHSSIPYAAAPQVWPVGPSSDYGGIRAALPIKGKIQAATGFATSAGIKAVLVDTPELSNPRNRMTPTLERVSGSFVSGGLGLLAEGFAAIFPEGIVYSTTARVKLKRLDNSNTGQFKLGVTRRGAAPPPGLAMGLPALGGFGFGNAILEIALAPLDATDPDFLAMPPDTTAVEISVILVEENPTEDAPILLNDVHAAVLLEDMVLGKFGRLKSDGGVLQAFTPEPASFTAAKADATIPTFRGPIPKRDKLREFVERALMRPPYNLGWRLDADNRVVVFDTRLPSSLAGVGTITNNDLVEAKNAFQWEQGRQDAITQLEAYWYVDLPMGPDGSVIAPAKMGASPTLLLRSVRQPFFDVTFGRADMGQKRETFDVIGFRAMPGELVQGQSRMSYIKRQLERGLEEIRAMFSTGPAYANLRCRRTANTSTWQVGQIKIVDVDPMPDPATNLRGGARVMMACARSERKAEIGFRLIDLGPNVIAAAPTLSGLATDTDDTAHGITVTLTLNAAGDPIEMHYAVTDSGVGTRPVETDPLWTFGTRAKTTGAIKVINLPAGKKIWVRARSIPGRDPTPNLPSVWAFPSTDNVTLASLAAPSGLGDTEISGRRFVVTFTPGDTRLPTEVLLATPTTDPRVRVKTLPPGATRAELLDLELSTTYRVGLQHRDSLGGLSTEVTRDVTTTGAAATAPNPGGIAIVIGAA
jgi:hypothetical protein